MEHNGDILLRRPNRGFAATARCNDVVRDIAFRADYSLRGDLGVATMKDSCQVGSWLLHAGQPSKDTVATKMYFDMRGTRSASALRKPFPVTGEVVAPVGSEIVSNTEGKIKREANVEGKINRNSAPLCHIPLSKVGWTWETRQH